MKNDSWLANYRSYCPDDSDSDFNHSSDGSKRNISAESRLMSELDISTRPDAAIFKPNPFSIAKINAFTRSSRPVVVKPTQPAEKPKNTATIDTFFKKTKQNAGPQHDRIISKKPVANKKPLRTGHRARQASSPGHTSTSNRDVEKQPPKAANLSVALCSDSTDRSQSNAPGTLSKRRLQAGAGVARHSPETRCVSSSGGVTHIPIQVGIQQELSIPVVTPLSKQTPDFNYPEASSPNACPVPRVVVHTPRRGKENQIAVPYQGSRPPVLARGKRESPLPVISSTNDRKSNSAIFKPISEVPPASAPQAMPRSHRASVKRLDKPAKVDSIAHITTPTVRNSPKCYEAKPDEDESWSTFPPRKKFKPSVQPMSKYKATRPFHIPGLHHDGGAMKSGMSASSSTRVITFLPTPLLPDSDERQVETEFENRSSSQSSQYHLSFDEENEDTRVRYSSPPTSDPPEADCDLNIRWDMHHLEERYTKARKAAEEYRRSKQLIWNLLGLDSNCYVYRDDDEEVETEIRIVLWRG